MKEWKVHFAIRFNDGAYIEQYLMQHAPTIGEALAAAEAKVAKMAYHMQAAQWAVWDIGIMDDNVF